MDNVTAICDKLDRKKELFLAYQEATVALLECPPDSAEHYIIRREELATSIDALAEEIDALCDKEPNGRFVMKVARGSEPFGSVPQEYHSIFYRAEDVRSVVRRISETDKQVVERLEGLRDQAQEFMQRNQNVPKIHKYLASLTDNARGIGLSNKV